MNIRLLIFREIRFNLGGFTAGVLAIFLSLISYLIAVSINADLKINTSKKLQLMKSELNEEVTALEDGIRKSMKGLGFNIYIYPENQDLSAVYERGYGDKTMPENYVSKLANSKSQNFYNSLRKKTQNKKGFFKYGANVGAGLPIIETLQNSNFAISDNNDAILPKIEFLKNIS